MTTAEKNNSISIIREYLLGNIPSHCIESVKYHVDKLISSHHYTISEIVERLGVKPETFKQGVYPELTAEQWQAIFNPLDDQDFWSNL